MIIPIRMKTGIVIKILSKENFKPRKPISKVIIGIFAVVKALMYMKTFTGEDPFFHKRYATGNAAYNGPAWIKASNITKSIPFMPEASPICFCTRSFGIHTSKRPIKMNITGRTKIISVKNIQKLSLNICIPGL